MSRLPRSMPYANQNYGIDPKCLGIDRHWSKLIDTGINARILIDIDRHLALIKGVRVCVFVLTPNFYAIADHSWCWTRPKYTRLIDLNRSTLGSMPGFWSALKEGVLSIKISIKNFLDQLDTTFIKWNVINFSGQLLSILRWWDAIIFCVIKTRTTCGLLCHMKTRAIHGNSIYLPIRKRSLIMTYMELIGKRISDTFHTKMPIAKPILDMSVIPSSIQM